MKHKHVKKTVNTLNILYYLCEYDKCTIKAAKAATERIKIRKIKS